MKKIIIALFLITGFLNANAQKANVSKAKNKALMENPDFSGAREAILPALKDSTTKNDANTWYVGGLIGYKENDALYQKALLNQPYDQDVKGKAILESYNYFIKADSLDQVPDKKGKVKPRYEKDIKAKVKEYFQLQQNLIAYGAYLFEKKKYDEVVKTFDTYLAIPKLRMMGNEIPFDSTYYKIAYYDAMAASYANLHDRSIALYEFLKDKKYESISVYELLYQEYQDKKDTVNFVKTLKDGFDKFPQEAWFLQNLINYFIYSGKTKDALTYLNTAIEREPQLAQYQYVKGNLDESLGNFDAAFDDFKKAIDLDPKLADAYAGTGRLYYNKAVKVLENANNIKDVKLYTAEQKKAEEIFKQSVPFFQKAAELKPKEIEYKKTLKTLYYRLKMDTDFEAISKEIDAM
jgi:tetratricopeptide (TPR) repeat protein